MTTSGNPPSGGAQEHNKRGNELMAQGQPAAALASYDFALTLEPAHLGARYNRGLALLALKRPAEALESYDRLLAASPDDAEALTERGNALLGLGRPDEALASYALALRLKPDHVPALYSQSTTLASLQRYDEALATLERLLGLQPDFSEALCEHGAVLVALGRPTDALASYEKALALAPDDARLLLYRGNLLLELKRHQEALQSFDRVLVLGGADLEALNNRGNALAELQRYEEALESYGRALAAHPNDVAILSNCSHVLVKLNRHEDALESLDRALALRPQDASLLVKRADSLLALRRHEDAVASYDRALRLKPQDVAALNDRGNALMGLARRQDALASYDRALALDPNNVTLLGNRGHVLAALGRSQEALASYDRALGLEPRNAPLLGSRGEVLAQLRRPQEALASYDRALALEPKLVAVVTNRGVALQQLRRNKDALESYDRALAIDPRYVAAHNNRADVLQSLGRYMEAAKSLRHVIALAPDHAYATGYLLTCQLHTVDWEGLASSTAIATSAIKQGKRAISPFALLAASDSPALQLQCSRIYVGDKYPASPTPFWTGKRYRHDRIRVAYLSADLHDHATAQLMIGIFEKHDRRKFETTAVSFGPKTDDAMQLRVKAAFERFIDVRSVDDREVARRVNEMEIDIAVDLKGFTLDARTGIFAYRPAPIQVNYLGYPGTMGAPYIDYIVADEFVIPEGDGAHYSEQVAYLPDTYQCNDSTRRIAERVPTRSEVGLPEQGFVFCCFNNHYKITRPIFDVWMRLLGRVDRSVLWLLAASDEAQAALRREAQSRGIPPDRLIFAPRVKLPEHLARLRLADLFLDTLPYNAHTTTSDALWAGLPVVTCAGMAFAGRVAGSLLRAVGLPELVTGSVNDYEALAFALATDAPRLGEIKKRLAQNRLVAPLFDTDRFRRHLEAAYVDMWERYQRGEPPATFAVGALPPFANSPSSEAIKT